MSEVANREARPAAGGERHDSRGGERNDRPPQGGRQGGGRPGGPGGGRPDRRGKRKFYYRKRKFCKFKAEKIDYIDFKDVELLRSFTPERGKIAPRRQTGTSAKFQRMLATAIKRARHIALLPYTTD
ncbi:30S ribosomal protein S18 [Sulfidibacter corallicola]|uniref:Small ribosomal subunit protein bS18 n=1 Tax=Sulfidibacter corallicola TaxID=2818388 RepID=A0A8A4TSM7_SULCO|nr:30S ribosomal protein S18 [Sulfidibacter corallicola]